MSLSFLQRLKITLNYETYKLFEFKSMENFIGILMRYFEFDENGLRLFYEKDKKIDMKFFNNGM